MYRIQVMNRISPAGLGALPPSEFSCGTDLTDPHAILVRSADLHELEFTDNLACIARAGAGTNNIPIDRCSEEGIVVFNTPGANANAVKELVLCSLFLASRDIAGGVRWAESLKGKGAEVPALVEKGKSNFSGPELEGKSLGIIGLGAIGVMVANAAHHLGMEVYGHDPYISVDAAWGLSRWVRKSDGLKTLLEKSDYITLHTPVTPETKHMLDASAFALMKPGVRLVNLARGELVSTPDLLSALRSGVVARYICDFPSDELLGEPNVVSIPHLGASTPESETNCATMAVRQMVDYLKNGNIKNAVNLPDVQSAREGAARICAIHRNIPEMVSRISNIVSSEHINIANMANRAKNTYAYTLIDIDSDIGPDVVRRMSELEGVLRVRVLR
ncbi:phosphoglycerate dehydrogenase [Oscillospiraceae bacterium OttesenSCG-928-G22]|nr:phosphoglycerate dehydrogenase [Oscillospiraceae bacterium OttesenSCG-928-G22]